MVVPSPAWRAPALVGAAVATATVVLTVINPETTHVPLCPLKAVTGLDCPFCGSLRAVHSLTHLHLQQAASHNLLFTLAVPFLVTAWLHRLVRALRSPDRRSPPLRLPRAGSIALVMVTAVFFVARNLPALSWLGSSA